MTLKQPVLFVITRQWELENRRVRYIRCVPAAAAAAAAVAASSWAVVNGITPPTLTADRSSGGIAAGSVPAAEGMYGNETLGNGTEIPDGRVKLVIGVGIDTDISTSQQHFTTYS